MGQKQGRSRTERYSTLRATCAVPSPLAPSHPTPQVAEWHPFFFRKREHKQTALLGTIISLVSWPPTKSSQNYLSFDRLWCAFPSPSGFREILRSTGKTLSFSYTYRCSPSLLRDTSFPFPACHSFSLLAFLITLICSFLLFSLLPVCFPLVPFLLPSLPHISATSPPSTSSPLSTNRPQHNRFHPLT
jgi:hypothetical protein